MIEAIRSGCSANFFRAAHSFASVIHNREQPVHLEIGLERQLKTPTMEAQIQAAGRSSQERARILESRGPSTGATPRGREQLPLGRRNAPARRCPQDECSSSRCWRNRIHGRRRFLAPGRMQRTGNDATRANCLKPLRNSSWATGSAFGWIAGGHAPEAQFLDHSMRAFKVAGDVEASPHLHLQVGEPPAANSVRRDVEPVYRMPTNSAFCSRSGSNRGRRAACREGLASPLRLSGRPVCEPSGGP